MRRLNNMPNSDSLWEGLGGNFSTFTQVICEFIDNSFSNFMSNNDLEGRIITITITEESKNAYNVEIMDSGTGIQNLDSAFTIGDKTNKESTLNEHGFGMKHALAAANKNNRDWIVSTCTLEEANNNSYSVIKAPYVINELPVINESGSFSRTYKTGTKIEFKTSPHWLRTIAKGLPGAGGYSRLDSLMQILSEDLGYIYSKFIEKGIGLIEVKYKMIGEPLETIQVSKVIPSTVDVFGPGINVTQIDLGNGFVTMEYEFLKVEESNYKKHYKANMSTSGAEIRINGRVLNNNIFKDIWNIEKHNSYNYMLIMINLISDDPTRLPSTITSKSGIRQDDEKLEVLYSWIREKVNKPIKDSRLSDHEVDLFSTLKDKREKLFSTLGDKTAVISNEVNAFTTIDEKIRIDMYESTSINGLVIYEGKKDKTSPQDVYQLMMYWDGLVYDGIKVDKGILISSEHPNSVKELIKLKNETYDQNHNKYKFELRTWKEYDVEYPK